MKNTYQYLSDEELIHQYKTTNNVEIIEYLIQKHQPILLKLAAQHTRRFSFTVQEDNLQNAKIGMIDAVRRYEDGNGAKFTTFLYKTVYYYLLTQNDNEAFVKCPPRLREVRSYYGGKYDDKKRQEIEQKYDLHSGGYALLSPEAIVISNDLETSETFDSFDRLSLWDLEGKIDLEDKKILNLLLEGHNMSEVARILTQATGKNYTLKFIRKKIGNIKALFNV